MNTTWWKEENARVQKEMRMQEFDWLFRQMTRDEQLHFIKVAKFMLKHPFWGSVYCKIMTFVYRFKATFNL